MISDDRALEWWRCVFAGRFGSGGLPCEDQTLYGARLHLMVEGPDGDLVPWAESDMAHHHQP